MANWTVWFVLAGAMVAFEIFTGTFYILMLALGLAAGGLVALAGGSATMQFFIAAVVGCAATYGLHQSGFGKRSNVDSGRDPSVNPDVGETVTVNEWILTEGLPPAARIMYRGAQWDAALDQGSVAKPGSYIIREVRGNRLILGNS